MFNSLHVKNYLSEFRNLLCRVMVRERIGKTPVRMNPSCPTTKLLIKAYFLIQPPEQEGECQKCCITLCRKVFMNYFYQMKVSAEYLNILTYWSKYRVDDRLRRTMIRKVKIGIFYQQINRLCHYILHQVVHTDCSAQCSKQHEPLTGVWKIRVADLPASLGCDNIIYMPRFVVQ